ncbi:MAG: hypothetical protein WBY93_01690 [Candidatus Binatus sp.]
MSWIIFVAFAGSASVEGCDESSDGEARVGVPAAGVAGERLATDVAASGVAGVIAAVEPGLASRLTSAVVGPVPSTWLATLAACFDAVAACFEATAASADALAADLAAAAAFSEAASACRAALRLGRFVVSLAIGVGVVAGTAVGVGVAIGVAVGVGVGVDPLKKLVMPVMPGGPLLAHPAR